MIEPADGAQPGVPGVPGDEVAFRPAETTGRFIVVFAEGTEAPVSVLRNTAGIPDVLTAREMAEDDRSETTPESVDAVFDELGMAVVSADPDQLGALQSGAGGRGPVLFVVPELVHHVRDDEYVRGYVDGVGDLAARLGVGGGAEDAVLLRRGRRAPRAEESYHDTDDLTWGLQAVRAGASRWSGRGVSVAVLDTGFDLGHPDFVGRSITARSFVAGEPPQDGHGHGTHCVGTACGPRRPDTGPRYGVAYGADIHVGKVLSNAGSGTDGGILAGLDWAVGAGCAVISMSLGADVRKENPAYTVAGRRALDRGCLVVAAAGNNARRDADPGFVGAPANSPDVLAVAALDHRLDVAPFSARTLPDAKGGQIDVAGPGVDVHSSWPMPTRYRSISGTSMATPHVAGLAALWAEATGFRGRELWSILAMESRRLAAPSWDVGSGLVLAP